MMASGYIDNHKDENLVTGASSVVIGHNPPMKIIAQLHQSGVPLEELQVRPANKVFHFGGDASSVAGHPFASDDQREERPDSNFHCGWQHPLPDWATHPAVLCRHDQLSD